MFDYSKTRIFKENSSRVLEIHDVVYQIGQGCPINSKREFSKKILVGCANTRRCLLSRTRMSDYSKTRIFGRKF